MIIDVIKPIDSQLSMNPVNKAIKVNITETIEMVDNVIARHVPWEYHVCNLSGMLLTEFSLSAGFT